MRFSTLLFIIISFSALSQERRLALVIGNSNYEKGPLQNPVNDALLMKETFEKLGFEVRLETDIETHNEFYQIISDYNKNRENYKVDFVYYAGHAVQIDGKNYMLATKENYESASDVKYKGIDIDIFTDGFGDPIENEINVLILDACRDNPFEKKIYGGTRGAFENGLGLAEIKNPPLGSLIAFSTAKGETAKDQVNESKNSFYCQSLSKNLMLEGVSLHNVFGKVCAEVYYETKQYPEVYDKMMGKDFYLKKTNFTDQIIEIDSLIESRSYFSAITKTSEILVLDPKNKQSLLRKAEAQFLQFKSNYDGSDLNKALSLFPLDPEVYLYMAKFEIAKGKRSKALPYLIKSIELDSTFSESYYVQSVILSSSNQQLDCINKALFFQPNNEKYLLKRSNIYQEIGDYQNAERDCFHVLKIDSSNIDALNQLGYIYESEGRLDEAIRIFDKGIDLLNKNPKQAAYCYLNKGYVLKEMGNYPESLKNLNTAIQIDPENSEFYEVRGDYFYYNLLNTSKAIDDYTRAIQLDSNESSYWTSRAMAFWETGKKEEAINDLNYASTIDSDDAVTALPLAISYFTIGMNEDAFRLIQNGIDNPNLNFSQKSAYFSARGLFYQELKDFKKAENDFTKAINFNADGAQFYWNRADLYWNRAHLYFQIQENNKALKDVNQAIYLSPNNFNYLYYRANVFFDVFNDTLNAIRDLKKILSISPSNVEAINLLGNIYQTNGRIDLAIDTYNKGIVLEHSEPYSAAYCYQNRGIIYAEIGELDKAKSDFDKAIFISPNNSDHYVWRGDFYSDYLKQESLAILDYSKAIELDSTNSSLWHSRAYSKEYIDDAGSLSDALHAYNLDTNSSQVMNFLSRLYIKKGYLDSATFILNRAITQQDATTYLLSGSYELMGYINILEENYQTAIKNYNEAIKLTPDDASSYWHRSQVYNRLGDVKAQLKDLNKAIELENNSPSLLSSRGLLYGRLKEYKKADLDFKEAHFKNESKSSVFLLEAKYLMNKQEFLKALTKLDSAILISPKDPEAFFYKALIYEELNKIPQCVHYYTLTHKLLLEKENYFVNDDEDNLMHISEVFNRIGMFYEKIGEYDLMCAVYSLALENLKTDQILRLSEIKEKMKLSVNSHCK